MIQAKIKLGNIYYQLQMQLAAILITKVFTSEYSHYNTCISYTLPIQNMD